MPITLRVDGKSQPIAFARRHFVALLLLSWMAAPAIAIDVVDNFDDGKPHFKYQVDAKKQRNGSFEELTPEGKVKVRGAYLANKKTGSWTVYSGTGKPLEQVSYRNDQLEGPYRRDFPSGQPQMRATFHQDDFAGPVTAYDEKGHTLLTVTYPRRFDLILQGWKALYPKSRENVKYLEEPSAAAPYKAAQIPVEAQQAALKYTMLYRFLSGVPFERMSIDATLVDKAEHGAVILAKIGSLTHTPTQPPDMDKTFFAAAYAGCNQSNIFQGRGNLFAAVDGFMDDSDATNVKAIGHRQWLLSPALQRTGFGCCGVFVVQHVLTGGAAPGFTFCAYPGAGYYPVKMLQRNAAWSVHFGVDKVKLGPADSLGIRVTPLDDHFVGSDPVNAEIVSVIEGGNANWRVIVFRPQLKSVEPGRYLVEITGIRTPGGAPAPFSYLVDLKEMPEE